MSNEIVRTTGSELSFGEQVEYAKLVTDGDLVPKDYRNKPANALIAIGLGQAMGLSPAESLYRIDVIQGKPTASAELIASNVRKAGHKLRIITNEQSMSVTAQIIRADDSDFVHEVTRDMNWAKGMGLHTKDNYKKQPLTMLQWRATSAVARLACPEALYGVTYTSDEMADFGKPKTSTPASPAFAALQDEPEPVDIMTGELQDEGERRDWMIEAGGIAGDQERGQQLWAEAQANGATEEELNYIFQQATKTQESK